jgi:septum site-determining protein MinC
VICGDVNAGAEVVAAGDVVVFGTLRGLAHAGCFGDESARILAFSLRPPQLRIAGHIARAPEDGGRGAAAPAPGARNPEVARIENGEIQISPW